MGKKEENSTAEDSLKALGGMNFNLAATHAQNSPSADLRDIGGRKNRREYTAAAKPSAKDGKGEKRSCTINLPRDLWDKLEDYEFYLKRVENKGNVTHTEVITEALDQFLTKRLKKIDIVFP